MNDKITAFAKLVEQHQLEQMINEGVKHQAVLDLKKTRVKFGSKYAKVDIGGAGRYMVEMTTGNIFGVKGYGVPHLGHFYGTVDTTAEYFWGHYYPNKVGAPETQTRHTMTYAPKAV